MYRRRGLIYRVYNHTPTIIGALLLILGRTALTDIPIDYDKGALY